IKVNSTYNDEFGEQTLNLTVKSKPQIREFDTIPNKKFFDSNREAGSYYIYANVSDLDNNVVSVNFTLIAPNGTVVINNKNASAYSGSIWNSTSFKLDQYGQWNYTIVAFDRDNNNDTITENINFLEINFEIIANPAKFNESTLIKGLILDSNKNIIPNNMFYIFVDNVSAVDYINLSSYLCNNSYWWNCTWKYKREINISNIKSNITNYPLKIQFNTSTLINNNKVKNDCSDIRFVDKNNNILKHWIVENCNSTNNTIYVSTNLSMIQLSNIYLYYGNQYAENISNINNVYHILEDMNNSPKGILSGSATYDSINKYVQLTPVANSVNGQLYYSINSTIESYISEFKFSAGGGNGADATWFYIYATSIVTNEEGANGGYSIVFDEYEDRIKLLWNGVTLSSIIEYNLDNHQWKDVKIIHYGRTTEIYLDNVLKINYTDVERTKTGNYVGWGARTGLATNYHRIKDLKVRPYLREDPSYIIENEKIVTYTNNSGNINIEIIPTFSPGIHTLKIESSYLKYYGEQTMTLYIQDRPKILNSNTIPNKKFFDSNNINNLYYIYANISDLDNNVVSVNFTLIAPNGTVVINNKNASAYSNNLWNSTSFKLDQYGLWNYSIFVIDSNENNNTAFGNISFLEINLNLDPSYVNTNRTISLFGYIKNKFGDKLSNYFMYLSINGTRYMYNKENKKLVPWPSTYDYGSDGRYLYRKKFNIYETVGWQRNNEHFRLNFSIEENRLSNENATILVCNNKQFPWDAYATAYSNGWVTHLEGLGEINISAYENLTCYIYYSPTYNSTEILPNITGWNYVGDTDRVGDVYDIIRGEENCNGTNPIGEYTSVCGDTETLEMNQWCYFKGQLTGNQAFWQQSDDEARLYIEGNTLISTNVNSATNTYYTIFGRYYLLKSVWSEGGGNQYLYLAHDSSNSNNIDTECYPFYGDEWQLNITLEDELIEPIVSNFSGDFYFILDSPVQIGEHIIKINTTNNDEYGEQTQILTVKQFPKILENYTSPRKVYFDSNFQPLNVNIIANVSDDNLISVNFTLIAPNGTVVIDNKNASAYSGSIWNSTSFKLDQYGQWNYTIV
ncbi:MAG: DUF2341 domain-containing protein, partial [Candidatus Woesearchaeota archaeon]